jgi:hypothetical protein
MKSSGIFDVAQLNSIRDAHLDWCASNSVDPKSALGEEAAAYLLKAFTSGHSTPDEMISSLDQYVNDRESRVQIGSAAIPSSGD